MFLVEKTMLETIHFISGLPRSGSTLLASILRQNPRFHAQMSGPVEHIYTSVLGAMSGRNDFSVFITEDHRKRVLRGIFETYYADIAGDKVIFDTNRNWPNRLPGLVQLFPDAKIICCVRDLVAILNSFEHLVKKNPFEVSRFVGFDPEISVYARIERLMDSRTGPVGKALCALREGYASENRSKLLLVDYDELIAHSEKVVSNIYKFINEPLFQHDMANLQYEEKEFDTRIGLPGMHTVRSKIGFEMKNQELILPKDIVEKYRHVKLV
jgi:sulfotransferase